MRNSLHACFLWILLLGGLTLGYGQEYALSVSVTDQETNEPLSGVTVYITQCECGGITNPSGLFVKRLASGTYDLTLDYLGYATQQIKVQLSANQTVKAAMEVVQEQLSEVVLTAKKRNQNVESPQMGVFELSSRELAKMPAALGEFDVLRSITMMAGVNNAGDISNGVSIRGGSLDQNLMLLESAPVFNPTHLFGLFSVFTPEVISGVDIYRANIPAKYGGRIASVVDVKITNPYTDRFKLEGGIGLISSRLSLTTPLIKDKLMLLAGGRVGFSDLLFPLLVPRLKNTRANFSDHTIKLLYLPSADDQITYTNFYSKDFYQLDLISSIENIVSSANQYDFSTMNHSMKWLHTFDNNTNLTTKLVASDYQPKNLFPEVDSDNVIRFESRIRYLSGQIEYFNNQTSKVDYYVGGQFNRYLIEPGSLDPGSGNSINPVRLGEETGDEWSVYGSADFALTPKLTLSSGFRVSQFNLVGPYEEALYDADQNFVNTQNYQAGEKVISYTYPEPRLGLNLKVGERASLKASYARMYQYIQNIYNTNTPLPTSRWKISDRYVKPQQNDTYGFGFYKDFDDAGLELSAETYYRNTSNNLTYKPGANFFLSRAIETEVVQADGRSYGLEFGLHKNTGRFNGFLNYTWARSLLKTNEAAPEDRINNNLWYASDFDRPHTVNATLNFEGDLYNKISFNFVGQTGRPYTIANGVYKQQNVTIPIYLNRNNARLPTYHRLDFSWTIAYSKDPKRRFKGDWVFTVYNIYGRKNPFNIYYAQRNGGVDGNVFLSSPLGAYELTALRGTLVSLSYNFRFQ
jgi:hypothetical protein